MANIVAAEYVTLDGVMEAPENWVFPFWNDELSRYTLDQLFASSCMLLGRQTYGIFAASWPSRTDDEGRADRMNGMPKYVVTSKPSGLDWNNSSAVTGGLAESVKALKENEQGDILIWGSGRLVADLLRHGLLDEIRLMVFPTVLGAGKRLFETGAPNVTMTLAESRVTSTGVPILVYRPAY